MEQQPTFKDCQWPGGCTDAVRNQAHGEFCVYHRALLWRSKNIEKRKAAGKCIRCGKEKESNGYVKCDSCLNTTNKARLELRDQRKKEGKCVGCGKALAPSEGAFVSCEPCRIKKRTSRTESNSKFNEEVAKFRAEQAAQAAQVTQARPGSLLSSTPILPPVQVHMQNAQQYFSMPLYEEPENLADVVAEASNPMPPAPLAQNEQTYAPFLEAPAAGQGEFNPNYSPALTVIGQDALDALAEQIDPAILEQFALESIAEDMVDPVLLEQLAMQAMAEGLLQAEAGSGMPAYPILESASAVPFAAAGYNPAFGQELEFAMDPNLYASAPAFVGGDGQYPASGQQQAYPMDPNFFANNPTFAAAAAGRNAGFGQQQQFPMDANLFANNPAFAARDANFLEATPAIAPAALAAGANPGEWLLQQGTPFPGQEAPPTPAFDPAALQGGATPGGWVFQQPTPFLGEAAGAQGSSDASANAAGAGIASPSLVFDLQAYQEWVRRNDGGAGGSSSG